MLATSQRAEAEDVKVAYIPCGQVNDGSWSEAGYIGVKDAKTALAKDGINVTISYSESLPPSQAETAARDYASKGYQTIVLHCGTFADAAYNAGKDFPKTNFLIVVAPRSENNVWSYTPAMQDISFVAGGSRRANEQERRRRYRRELQLLEHHLAGGRLPARRAIRQSKNQGVLDLHQ